MNNSIIIKGADFSTNKVGKLNIQKLTVTKAGNGAKDASSGSLIDVPSSGWYPAQNMAYSSEISIPSGTKYIFGKLNMIALTSVFEEYMGSTEEGILLSNPAPSWIYHDTVSGNWVHVMGLVNTMQTKPNILGYKQDLFDGSRFVVALFDGGIYGHRFQDSLNIDKIIVNWFREDGAEAPEVGLVVPELYVGF